MYILTLSLRDINVLFFARLEIFGLRSMFTLMLIFMVIINTLIFPNRSFFLNVTVRALVNKL